MTSMQSKNKHNQNNIFANTNLFKIVIKITVSLIKKNLTFQENQKLC